MGSFIDLSRRQGLLIYIWINNNQSSPTKTTQCSTSNKPVLLQKISAQTNAFIETIKRIT